MFGELDIAIPLFGMVKMGAITSGTCRPAGEVEIDRGLYPFFGQISDEVHRFAQSYHNKVRSANSRRSALENIPGVGRRGARPFCPISARFKKLPGRI
jgi:excinuclease ABC subunit C